MTAVRRLWPVVCCLVTLSVSCGRAWDPKIVELPSPAAERISAEPRLTAFKRRVILSWIERVDETASLKFAERTPAGWTEPRLVASGDDWFVNWADVPSVVRVGEQLIAAHWLQMNGPDPEGYDVKLAWSRDDGKTWSAPASPHHDGTPTEHGFASLYPAPGGGLGLVWLDGRAGETMAVRSATFDSGGAQKSEAVVDDRVCECCPTAAVATTDGIVAAYRDQSNDQVRDIYVARFASGAWSKPAAVYHDDWRIDACPVNGPALAADGSRVAIAWFNAKVDQGHAFVAFSTDGGSTFGSPIRVDDASSLGRVDVALLADGSAAVAWIEFADGRAQFRLRRITPAGARSDSTVVSGLASGRASGYPRLTRAGDELVFAWTESQSDTTRVRTASMRLQR